MNNHRLKSRKFWVALIGAGILLANDAVGLDLAPETQTHITVLLASFIVGESAIDFGKMKHKP